MHDLTSETTILFRLHINVVIVVSKMLPGVNTVIRGFCTKGNLFIVPVTNGGSTRFLMFLTAGTGNDFGSRNGFLGEQNELILQSRV